MDYGLTTCNPPIPVHHEICEILEKGIFSPHVSRCPELRVIKERHYMMVKMPGGFKTKIANKVYPVDHRITAHQGFLKSSYEELP